MFGGRCGTGRLKISCPALMRLPSQELLAHRCACATCTGQHIGQHVAAICGACHPHTAPQQPRTPIGFLCWLNVIRLVRAHGIVMMAPPCSSWAGGLLQAIHMQFLRYSVHADCHRGALSAHGTAHDQVFMSRGSPGRNMTDPRGRRTVRSVQARGHGREGCACRGRR